MFTSFQKSLILNFCDFKLSSALIAGSSFLWSQIEILFTENDFCKFGAIQGFDLNIYLCLLIFLKDVKLSNNLLILFKNISVE